MGNHTRKCSIVGCDKKAHGRGFCISHFSAGVHNLPKQAGATGDCIPWEGRPEKFQAAAVRSLVLDDKEVPPWAWVVVNCGSEMCLLSDHLEVHFPHRLHYPHHLCIYCGRPGYTKDHILPRNWTGESVRTFTAIVPACGLCNGLISDALAPSVTMRRQICHIRLRRKFSNLMRMPKWTNEQLHGVEGSLRSFILSEVSRREEVKRMLDWPNDPVFDLRAMERSGIEDPFEAGLLESEDSDFHDKAHAIAA